MSKSGKDLISALKEAKKKGLIPLLASSTIRTKKKTTSLKTIKLK